MKALVKTQKGKGYLELKEVPVPEIGDHEVLIRIEAAGICGTDFHIYNDEFPYWPPVILGHEFSGTIAAAGKRVVDWKTSDRVVGEPHTLACGKCYLCRTGNPQICASKRSPGWGINGAFAEYMRWPEPHLLHCVPNTLRLDTAALCEPLANVVSDVALNNTITLGDVVVVAGVGPIGIMAAVVARHVGAAQVILLGRNESKMDIARTISSISQVVDLRTQNVVELVLELTHGRGADVFIDASGSAQALSMGAQLIRKLGTFVGIGFSDQNTIDFPYRQLMMKGVKFLFNVSTKYESWDRSLALLESGVIPHEKIITRRKKIDAWKEVFEDPHGRESLKNIFTF